MGRKIYHFLQAYWYRFLVDAKIYECNKFNKKMQNQGDLSRGKDESISKCNYS